MNTRTTLPLIAVPAASLALLLGACGGAPTPAAPVEVPTANTAEISPAQPPAPEPAAPAGRGRPQLLAAQDDPRADLDADDQRGDGATAVIEEAELSVPGHVAIYDATGTLLGSAPVPAGETRNLAVPLDPAVPAGNQRLLAVLHADDGDGAFDPTLDPPAREIDDDIDDDDDVEDDRFDYAVS